MRKQLIAGLPRGTRSRLLPLLPSGPDGVHNLPLRGTQLSVDSANTERDIFEASAELLSRLSFSMAEREGFEPSVRY